MEKIFNIDEFIALRQALISKIGELRYLVELYPDVKNFQKSLEIHEALFSKISTLY